jgi:hypothetical protein
VERLTEIASFPLTTFNRCQLCGFTDKDICEFRMWQECDEEDKPEPYNVLVLCRSEQCMTKLREHPRLYREMPWGQGQPGHLMLVCGPCTLREGTRCSHSVLKANGGEGLKLYIDNFLANAVVCSHDENGELRCNHGFHRPFVRCDGFEDNSAT